MLHDDSIFLTSLKCYFTLTKIKTIIYLQSCKFKFTLIPDLGYHRDLQTRAAFMEVLTKILQQGTEFDTLAETVLADRFEQLVQLVTMISDKVCNSYFNRNLFGNFKTIFFQILSFFMFSIKFKKGVKIVQQPLFSFLGFQIFLGKKEPV